MAKKATGTAKDTAKVKISYKKLHEAIDELLVRVKEVRKVRPLVTKLKVLESSLRLLRRSTECQKVMVIEL